MKSEGNIYDVLVIGAGQAGLAAGYYLQQTGLRYAILDAQTQPGGNWPAYYDSLKLFSPARYSSLPGYPFPGDPNRYPLRDEVVAYLRAYAEHFHLLVLGGQHVRRVIKHAENESARFTLEVSGAEPILHCRALIVATGGFGKPNWPHLAGQKEFAGRQLHSAEYRNPESFLDQRVLVVGSGNSAVQIGVELAQYARVTLASLKPVKYRSQRIAGQDIHFWARAIGYDQAPLGVWFGARSSIPLIDDGHYRAALAAGKPNRRPLFQRLTRDGVQWNDTEYEKIDAVIYATGFRPAVEFLRDCGALNAHGTPYQRDGISLNTPQLYYVGLEWQHGLASATLRGVGPDAKRLVHKIKKALTINTHKVLPLNYSWPAQRIWQAFIPSWLGRHWTCCNGQALKS